MSPHVTSIVNILSHSKVEITIITVAIIMIIITISIDSKHESASVVSIVKEKSLSLESIVTIDLEGALNKPGIYRLSSRKRLFEAIREAGGLADNADREYVYHEINLASYIHDQDKIYIPRKGERIVAISPSKITPVTYKSVSINKATLDEIDIIPGIGKTTALKIIQNRPYSSLNDLIIKKVVSKTTFGKIEKYIHL